MGLCFSHYISLLASLLQLLCALPPCDSPATKCQSPSAPFLGEENSPSSIPTGRSSEELLAPAAALDINAIPAREKGKRLSPSTGGTERAAPACTSHRTEHLGLSTSPTAVPSASRRRPGSAPCQAQPDAPSHSQNASTLTTPPAEGRTLSPLQTQGAGLQIGSAECQPQTIAPAPR